MKQRVTRAILDHFERVETAIGDLPITNQPLPLASQQTPYDLLNRYLIGAGAQIFLAEDLELLSPREAEDLHRELDERFTVKWNRIMNES